jgi:hypothetical protein
LDASWLATVIEGIVRSAGNDAIAVGCSLLCDLLAIPSSLVWGRGVNVLRRLRGKPGSTIELGELEVERRRSYIYVCNSATGEA